MRRLAVALVTAVVASSPGPSRAAGGAHPHWTYEGKSGPERWGGLSPDFAACARGKAQSPIDLGSAVPAEPLPELAFDYHPASAEVRNNGHTIEVSPRAAGTLRIGDATYRLQQFHFHHPSEHTVRGEAAPLEVHLVHRDDRGHLAVVGILVHPGEPNPALERVWSALPRRSGETRHLEQVDLAALIPPNHAYWRYTGSLTTPPCTEGVTWIVMESPLSLEPGDVDAFAQLFPDNSRPVQPRNARHVAASR
jgi:carbonic anhydrase